MLFFYFDYAFKVIDTLIDMFFFHHIVCILTFYMFTSGFHQKLRCEVCIVKMVKIVWYRIRSRKSCRIYTYVWLWSLSCYQGGPLWMNELVQLFPQFFMKQCLKRPVLYRCQINELHFFYKHSVFQSEARICISFSQIQPQNMPKICLFKNVQKTKFHDFTQYWRE